MASPAKKKRKLEGGSGGGGKGKGSKPARGLEYFFSKKKDNDTALGAGRSGQSSPALEQSGVSATPEARGETPSGMVEMSDEELARKLQAEWDEEDRRERLARAATAEAKDSPAVPEPVPVLAALPAESKPMDALWQAEGQGADIATTSAMASSRDADITTTSAMASSRKATTTLSLQSVTTAEDLVTATLPLDESPLAFEPSRYMAALKKQWGGDRAPASYALLTRCFVLVSATKSRIKIIDTLVNCLRLLIEGDPASLLPAVWLATNAIGPAHVSMELGLGGSAIGKALKQVCGLDARGLKALFDKYGDPGDVAYEAKKRQVFTLRKPQPLTIQGVYQTLVKVAQTQGAGSVEAKQRLVDRLLQDARGGDESRYVVRTLCQHLRIGAVKTTMLIALSRAFVLSGGRPAAAYLTTLPREDLAERFSKAEELVKACYARRPDYNDLVPALLELGVCEALLVRCGLALHVPIRPMLGSITRDLGEMLVKLPGRAFACEFKYDGQRAQVHCDEQGRVSIFSRHLEDMTDKYPDLVSLVPRIRDAAGGDGGGGVRSFIMEGEVVAVDRQTGEIKTFQALTNRARKDVALDSIKVDVCLFAFDLMFLNGQPLLDRPFRERRALLRSLFVEIPHHFTWVASMDAVSEDVDAISGFFQKAIDAKCEGIMVKILDNLPEPADEGEEDAKRDSAVMDGGAKLGPVLPGKAKVMGKKKGKAKAASDTTAEGKQQGSNGQGAGAEAGKRAHGRRKPLLATYEPDKRLDSWLKVKKDYGSTFDTLDLIPIAGWHGMGRKAQWWSPILMAVRNEETGSLEAVTKCISGFTDAFYKANRAFYDDGQGDEGGDMSDDDDKDDGSNKKHNTRTQKPSFVEYHGPEPDVWFEPQEVWEMAFADITLSPTYTAAIGLVSEDRGLSMRFPRFLRKRDDKSIEEASTSEFLASLYRKQAQVQVQAPREEEGDD